VLLFLKYSDLGSRKDADARTRFSDGPPMTIPNVSANMDRVTESGKAVALARLARMGVA
jgi:IMP dehydrogenase/GMP reductase